MMDNEQTYPKTFRTQKSISEDERPQLFDPALSHFTNGFQLGDYVSKTPEERVELERVRSEVRLHLLSLVAASRWRDHLALRGSLLVQLWFPELARDPKDIDWVFLPENVKADDAAALECLAELADLAAKNPRTANAEILAESITTDDIWTYDRASGKRLLFPYKAENGIVREIQMDIVWAEPVYEPPFLLTLPSQDNSGEDLQILSVTPAQSLAWKLLWLLTDVNPQGKDLYDAVLLAEWLCEKGTPLTWKLLKPVLVASEDYWVIRKQIVPSDWGPNVREWGWFKLAFPWVDADENAWMARLSKALEQTFNEPGKVYELAPRSD